MKNHQNGFELLLNHIENPALLFNSTLNVVDHNQKFLLMVKEMDNTSTSYEGCSLEHLAQNPKLAVLQFLEAGKLLEQPIPLSAENANWSMTKVIHRKNAPYYLLISKNSNQNKYPEDNDVDIKDIYKTVFNCEPTENLTGGMVANKIKSHYEQILNNIPQSVYWKDKNAVYLGCNKTGAELVGLEHPSDIIGMTDYDLEKKLHWPKGVADAFRTDDFAAIKEKKPIKGVEEKAFNTASGELIYQLTTRVPFDYKENETGVIGISTDITELHHTRFENQDLKDELALANREKRIFIYVLSARVLNALSAIKTAYDLFSQMADTFPVGYANILSLMDNATRKIIHMFDHMTDFLDLQDDIVEKMSIQDLAAGLIRKSVESTDKKPVLTLVDCDRALSPWQLGDVTRIRRVLRNLLENAVAYTEHGFIKVSIRVEEQSMKDEPLLKITIQDTGCGIQPERLPHLFDVFERTSVENNPYQSGGFILSLTKKLIERLSGSIEVSSQAGQGTTFTLEIPVSVPETKEGNKIHPYPTVTISPCILSDNTYFLDVFKTFIPIELAYLYSSDVTTWVTAKDAVWSDKLLAIIDGRIGKGVLQSFVNQLSPLVGDERSFFVVVVDKDETIDYGAVLPKNWLAVPLSFPLTSFSIEEEFIQEYRKWQNGQFSSLKHLLTPQTQQLKALVIEDNRLPRKALTLLIHSQNLDVTAVETVEAIIEQLDSHEWPHYALLFLDIELPGMSGVDFMKYLRRHPIYKNVIIIVNTAYTSAEDEIRYFDAGADEVLQKPVTLKKVQEMLDKYFPNRR